MKRSAPLRRSPFRRRRRPSRQREARPGWTPPQPRGWRGLSLRIKVRDKATCRRCRQPAPTGAADHVIPRRLLPKRISRTRLLEMLVWLCPSCHAWKTQVCEPALYRGDLQPFGRLLGILEVKDPWLVADAYRRLRVLLR